MQSLSYAVLEQIVAASVQGVLVLETQGPTARIRYANPAYERVSGYSANELVGDVWNAHWVGSSVDGSRHEALDRLMTRATPGSCSLTCLAKDGSVWQSEVHLSRIGNSGQDASLLLAQHVVNGEEAADDGLEGAAAALVDRARAAGSCGASRRAGPLAAGMLSTHQFMALLGRDLAIARRHERAVTLFLFRITEYEVYQQTFGQLAADACARMIATQILGTFGRAIDLRARLDETSFVVAVHDQPEDHSQRLAKVVADKTARLRLPNPKAHLNRYVAVESAVVRADPWSEDGPALIERARKSLNGAPAEAAMHATA